MTAASAKAPLGFTFTETMEGFVAPDAADFADGARRGKKAKSFLKFRVTMHMDDLGSFLDDPDHAARMTGTVTVPGHTNKKIREGVFNLLARSDDGHRQMRYAFVFDDDDGHGRRFEGFKDVHNDWTFDFWKDTTTLFTTVAATDLDGAPAAVGILRIKPLSLVPQVLSFRARNSRNPLRHVQATARFSWFFTASLWDEYHPRFRRPRRH
jgi:cholesterol oxidase